MKKQDVEMPTEPAYDPAESEPTKLEHFPIYNKWARKNKISVKVPDESFYKKVKVRFQRFDQPTNVLKCIVRKKDIEWRGELIPGCVYDLAIPVIKWLSSLSEPIFAQVQTHNDAGDGRTIIRSETKQVGEKARFSLMQLELLE